MKTYSKLSLEAVQLASQDETRSEINCLKFEGNKTIATDGYKLVIVDPPESGELSPEDWPENGTNWDKEDNQDFMVPAEMVKRAIKNLPKKVKKYDPEFKRRVAIGKLEKCESFANIAFETTDGEAPAKVELAEQESGFPDYRQAIPDITDYFKIGRSANYLEQICGYLKKFADNKNQDQMVVFHIPDSNTNSVVITTENDAGYQVRVVLMPMQL